MKMPPKRVVAAAGFLLSLIGVGLAFWSYPNIADADHDDVQLASIASVRAHQLTPGPITTVAHLAARGGCPTTTVSYQSDGLKTYALAMRPKTKMPTSGYPVIIFAHGYTDPTRYHTDNSQYENMLTWFCSHDFLVLKPDYRGHGQSDGVAVNGLYSPSDTYDVLNLAASLPNYAPADPHHIALVGHSMGGGVVLRAAIAPHGLPFTAVVTIAGAVDSLTNMTYHWQGHVPPDVAIKRNQIIRQEGPPNQNPGYWHDASATNYLASRKGGYK